jgi:hypothetical protein
MNFSSKAVEPFLLEHVQGKSSLPLTVALSDRFTVLE